MLKNTSTLKCIRQAEGASNTRNELRWWCQDFIWSIKKSLEFIRFESFIYVRAFVVWGFLRKKYAECMKKIVEAILELPAK